MGYKMNEMDTFGRALFPCISFSDLFGDRCLLNV